MDLLKPFQDKQTGKWGCCNSDEHIIIPFIYDEIEYITYKENSFLKVRKENKVGVFNIDGQLITECINDSLELMGDKLIKIEREKKFGIIDKYGKELHPCVYSKIKMIYIKKKIKHNQEKVFKNSKFVSTALEQVINKLNEDSTEYYYKSIPFDLIADISHRNFHKIYFNVDL